MDSYRILDVNGVDLCVDTAADPAILLMHPQDMAR